MRGSGGARLPVEADPARKAPDAEKRSPALAATIDGSSGLVPSKFCPTQ